jgi:hypothetical protein
LGTGRVADGTQEWMSYKDAKDYIKTLNLKSGKDWKNYCKTSNLPINIPKTPSLVYKHNGWISMGEWLGTFVVASYNIKYREFEKAREFAKSLNFKTFEQWREFCKSGNLPSDIPKTPYNTYKDKGWKGNGDWLGTDRLANFDMIYLPFEEAKKIVKTLGIRNANEWRSYCKSGKKPANIPNSINKIYEKSGWKGWGDFFGTGKIANYNVKWRDYEVAKILIHTLNLKSASQYRIEHRLDKLPKDIPSSPNTSYKNKGWVSWGDWLGTGSIADGTQEWMSFKDAKEFVLKLKLKGKEDWFNYSKNKEKPVNIPVTVNKIYAVDWKGWADFLGKEK